jgi:DNA-binding transcriptional MerR regulator
MRSRERGGDSLGGGPNAKNQRGAGGYGGGNGNDGEGRTVRALPTKTHVLRYWETEFRSIRPQKSSRGQRVYSRRDVETLMRVKELLYDRGFTIAGARKQLRDGGIEPREPADPALRGAARMRAALLDIRKEIVSLLESLDG